MAFYTAEYIKKLVKEDEDEVVKTLKKKEGRFRDYIDSTLPFTLYLDIDNISKLVVIDNNKFIQGSRNIVGIDEKVLKDEIISTYKKVINYYINSYYNITSKELESKLNQFKDAVIADDGKIKYIIQSIFKNTMVSKEVSKVDLRVLIISPKFTTIQSAFGKKFKELFDYSKFPSDMDIDTGNTPSKELSSYLSTNFKDLQNLGHMEVDILSSSTSEVKRGIVSPALLSALVNIPKGMSGSKVARQFSKVTGQAETRIVVRKQFTGSKLVLEMLIEAGMMIGGVENSITNLEKAPKEGGFHLGKGLKNKILADSNFIANLETSKSIKQFIEQSTINVLKGLGIKEYASSTTISSKVPISTSIVKVDLTSTNKNVIAKPIKISQLRNKRGQFTSFATLQTLLSQALSYQIKKNMGTGNSREVLNFRTGRLAESANVERISQSRAGMLTAFYSYMKYPYATFSEGGRQELPRSRDPKLLISKSIREIASTIVGNRMRAVNI